jgi:hypothetical protein
MFGRLAIAKPVKGRVWNHWDKSATGDQIRGMETSTFHLHGPRQLPYRPHVGGRTGPLRQISVAAPAVKWFVASSRLFFAKLTLGLRSGSGQCWRVTRQGIAAGSCSGSRGVCKHAEVITRGVLHALRAAVSPVRYIERLMGGTPVQINMMRERGAEGAGAVPYLTDRFPGKPGDNMPKRNQQAIQNFEKGK